MSLTGTTSNTSGLLSGYSNPTSTNGGEYGFQGISTAPMTTAISGGGVTLNGSSTISYSNNLGLSTAVTNSKSMAPKQVNVAVFTVTRDVDTAEVVSTKFVKQLWVEQKNGASIDLIVAKQLDKDFDPEFTIIKVLSSVSF